MANGDEVSNNRILFRDYISGTSATIKLKVPEGSNSVLLKNLYSSCDPYMLGRMTLSDSYVAAFTPGSPITGYAVSEVLDSGNPNFEKGDYVWGFAGWEQYSLIKNPDPSSLRKINYTDVPLSYHTGILGMPGMTAYVGFNVLASPKMGESVYVSDASGAVDRLLADLTATLKRYFSKGIDIYFENPDGVHNLTQLVLKRVRMQGFNVFDHYHLYPEFMELMKQYFMDEKLVYVEDMVEGLESAPAALIGLFTGQNVGKQVVKVSHE
ncbi:hypothetical protein MKW98_030017 [Papaver atlanticum]|uniref:Oxidoreductase N-terminal domain-containing protein n=1 Tax=Papaver atlanticum TaxID=357466 RepID=A0AAD4XSX5_9MAGN|nr:hypothetical protein MKW98_030017 [Papaver atlanticum]